MLPRGVGVGVGTAHPPAAAWSTMTACHRRAERGVAVGGWMGAPGMGSWALPQAAACSSHHTFRSCSGQTLIETEAHAKIACLRTAASTAAFGKVSKTGTDDDPSPYTHSLLHPPQINVL